jgi:DNA-binding transcriptional ArsR family regulator
MPTADPLSLAFAALADPTRRAILKRLARGSATVGVLAAPFALSLPAVSRHLKVLARARLIERETRAQWRVVRLRPAALRQASGWLDHYRKFWDERLDGLAGYLGLMPQDKEIPDARKSKGKTQTAGPTPRRGPRAKNAPPSRGAA